MTNLERGQRVRCKVMRCPPGVGRTLVLDDQWVVWPVDDLTHISEVADELE